MERLLLSKKEAAVALGISVRTVEYLIASKQLDARRIGRRRLVPRTALEKLARRDVHNPALQSAAEDAG